MPNNHEYKKKKIIKVKKLQTWIDFEIYVLSVSDLEKRKMPTTATPHLHLFCWIVFSHIYVKQFYCSFWSKAICMYSFSIKLIYRKFSRLALLACHIHQMVLLWYACILWRKIAKSKQTHFFEPHCKYLQMFCYLA